MIGGIKCVDSVAMSQHGFHSRGGGEESWLWKVTDILETRYISYLNFARSALFFFLTSDLSALSCLLKILFLSNASFKLIEFEFFFY